jgi:hypothetical protein
MGRRASTGRGIISGLRITGDFIFGIPVYSAMKNYRTIIYTVAAFAILFISGSAIAQSCPMCKESMTAAGAKLSEGFYNSIMSMFLLPISMIGTGTVFVMKSGWMKKHPEAQELSTLQVIKEMVKERRAHKN